MYIDFLTMILLNSGIGFILLAFFLLYGWEKREAAKWMPGFLLTGSLNTLSGLMIVFTWPLPKSYNILYGELSVFSGILFLGLAFSLYWNWDFMTLGVYSFFTGILSFLMGIKILQAGITSNPQFSSGLFFTAGISGILLFPLTLFNQKFIRLFSACFILISAFLFFVKAYGSYWNHIDKFMEYSPK